MTKKKLAKRIASNGPRLPGQPTKKTVKARARARKQEVPVVSAEDVRDVLVGHKGQFFSIPLDDVGLVGQQAMDDSTLHDAGIIKVYGVPKEELDRVIPIVGHAQPVDVPIKVTPVFEVPEVTRRELRLNPPNLSPKQQRAKRRLEDGTGWRCLGCYRVLHPKLNSCPYCSKRKLRA